MSTHTQRVHSHTACSLTHSVFTHTACLHTACLHTACSHSVFTQRVHTACSHSVFTQRVHTGRLVGQMTAQIGHYNLLRFAFANLVLFLQNKSNFLLRGQLSKYFKYKLLTIFQTICSPVIWSPVTPIIAPIEEYLFVASTPEQIIMTYLRNHQTYQSACVNTGYSLDCSNMNGLQISMQEHTT